MGKKFYPAEEKKHEPVLHKTQRPMNIGFAFPIQSSQLADAISIESYSN